MSCVIGYVGNDRIVIGADSCISSGYMYHKANYKKIFRKGDMYIGVVGRTRTAQIIENLFVAPARTVDTSPVAYITGEFIRALRECVKENDDDLWFTVMLVYGGKLYTIDSDFSILESPSFHAIGSGADFALGALSVLSEVDVSPERRVEVALEISARHAIHVAQPWQILSIDINTNEEIVNTETQESDNGD